MQNTYETTQLTLATVLPYVGPYLTCYITKSSVGPGSLQGCPLLVSGGLRAPFCNSRVDRTGTQHCFNLGLLDVFVNCLR